MWKRWIESTLLSDGCGFSQVIVLYALCVAEGVVSCTVDFPHSSPGFSLLPWEGFGSGGDPAQGAAVLQPCPSVHSPMAGMSLLLKNWLWLQLCPFHAVSSAISTFFRNSLEGNAEACLLHLRKQHVKGKLPSLFVWCLWQAAWTWCCGLRWAPMSQMSPGRSWLLEGYSGMIMAFLPSAAGWQAQRNADLSQSEIKRGT